MTVQDLVAESAEKALIGALVLDRDAIASVADRLTVDAFATARYRAIYAAVQRCWTRRIAPDIVSVHAEMANDPLFAAEDDWQRGVLDLTGAMAYVVANGYGCHAPMYAERVVEQARQRAIAEAGTRMVALSQRSGADPALAMQEALAGLDRFGSVEGPRGPRTYEELIPDYQERIMRMRSGEIPNRVLSTGYRSLDRVLAGGFYPGELIILAGRPAMGKSALGLQIGHHVAKQGKHTLVFSAEMGADSLLRRAASELSGIAADSTLDEREYDLFLQALDHLRTLPVSIDDTSSITTAQMQVRIQAEQRRREIGLVVFDYIGLAGDSVPGDQEQMRVTKIVRALKHIARVCDVAVLALAQLNRNPESRDNKRPGLSDLRDSGSLEQEADKVLFLYRNAYYVNMGRVDPEPGREDIAELIVAKHRNGPTGTIDLHFQASNMMFHEVAYREPGMQRQAFA